MFQSVPERDHRLQSLESGAADVVELDADEVRWHVTGESFQRVSKLIEPSLYYDYVCWNTRRPPFDNPQVRRALALAVDVENMRETEFDGIFQPLTGIFGLYSWAQGTALPSIGYNPDEAKRLLDSAGWRATAPGGLRSKDGELFTIELTTPSIGNPSQARVAQRIAQYLAHVGVSVEIRAVDGTQLRAIRNGGAFDAFIGAVGTSANPVRDERRWRTGGGANDGQYSNPDVDELFDKAREAPPGQERRARLLDVQRTIHDDQPYLFLWYKPTRLAISTRLRGLTVSPLGIDRHYPGQRAWWVPLR
jgi:ABC-type transport system substrate-binding protein